MAVLEKPKSPANGVMIKETAPEGVYLAVCIDAQDEFNVERKKFQSEETETVDLTRFTFGIKAKDGHKYAVRSKRMKISGHEKSTLVAFLKAWNGKAFPYGVDYVEWGIGRGAQVTVEQFTYNGQTYANIASIAPVMEGLEDKVPKVADFSEFFASDRSDTTSSTSPESSQNEPEEDPPF